MTAGLNLKASLIGIVQLSDDGSGGAQTTGTVRHEGVRCAMTPRRPTQQALEAGLETDAIYDFTCTGNGITLNERDEILVTWPLDHSLYNLRFRVTGVQPGRRRPRYMTLHATASRIRRSRSVQ